jgi:homoserine dehydrogenase
MPTTLSPIYCIVLYILYIRLILYLFYHRYADNIIAFSTERYVPQPLVIQGPGAGAAVTAAGIYADFLRIVDQCPE